VRYEHLTPEEVSAYVARAVAEGERSEIEGHLVTCDQCREELLEAYRVTGSGRAGRWLFLTLPAAAAAILLLLVLGPDRDTGQRQDLSRVMRSEQIDSMSVFTAVEPADSAVVDPVGLTFRWHTGGPEPYYRITLTDVRGDIVWTATTSDTSIQLPTETTLAPGQTYFWYVDALLRGARSATTGVREFVTEP